MRIGTSLLAAVALILLGTGLGTMFSEPKTERKEAKKQNTKEAWAELLQPREEHKWLAEQVGEWNVEARMWKDGEEEPISLHGSAKITQVFDRFIYEECRIGEGDKLMEARGYMGFDSSNEEFNASYITNDCVAIHVLTGQRKDGTLELSASWMEKGLDNSRVSQRLVCVVTDKDHHVNTIYTRNGQGPEQKLMELTYTRKQ